MITLATTQFSIQLAGWEAFKEKTTHLAKAAHAKQAQLLMLPEYAGAAIGDSNLNDAQFCAALQKLLPQYIEHFSALAKQFQLYILAGTILVAESHNHYVNRAYFFAPDGHHGFQDKLQLIEYEKQSQFIAKGQKQSIFTTPFGKLGIAVCYDCEFPEIIRNLTRAGAWLILIPSYTTTMHGFYRIHLSARARAIENQCYVATSVVVGKVKFGSGAEEQTHGCSGIYSPIDAGFPEDGILCQGDLNQEQLIFGALSEANVSETRKSGAVKNFTDSLDLADLKVETVRL